MPNNEQWSTPVPELSALLELLIVHWNMISALALPSRGTAVPTGAQWAPEMGEDMADLICDDLARPCCPRKGVVECNEVELIIID